MISVRTILHPTDFSRCAGVAFQAACSLARDRGAQLIVLHVREPVLLSWRRRGVEVFSPARQDCRRALHALRARAADVAVAPVMRKGDPAEAILALAREVPCDLIVMGMRGRTGEGLPGLGRVAAGVARLARCPVLGVRLPRAAPGRAPASDGRRTPGRPWTASAR